MLYNLVIHALEAGIRVAAWFHPKARKWVSGRRDWAARLQQQMGALPAGKTLWVHVASLGEFEQGRPVIEQFRTSYPDWRIVLTFFSPSGYEIRQNYPLVDVVAYLPMDTPRNSHVFLEVVQPDLAIFVKYDFWANYLLGLKRRKCPTLLVAALFRPDQPFFQWYGRLWREMLTCFSHIFAQDQASVDRLHSIGYHTVSRAGDTRVDRVLWLSLEAKPDMAVEAFVGDSVVLMAGSTWEADELLLHTYFEQKGNLDLKLIVAPHEPSAQNVARICRLFGQSVRLSQFQPTEKNTYQVLVIDNVGMLNRLYRYGAIAYIGGGFGKGIHNTLEPAAFGLPILFGPKYEKFEEARQFVQRGGAFTVHDKDSLTKAMSLLLDKKAHKAASTAVKTYLEESKGATQMAMDWIKLHPVTAQGNTKE